MNYTLRANKIKALTPKFKERIYSKLIFFTKVKEGGGAYNGNRTYNLVLTMDLLYHWSYAGEKRCKKKALIQT